MIININGQPGIGKLTIGRLLAEQLKAKLLDNHSIYNVALALTEFRSDAFYETVRAVRDVAYERLLTLPREMPVVLTNWFAQDSRWAAENWNELSVLAQRRGAPLFHIVMSCSPEENKRRIQTPERLSARKPQDVALVDQNKGRRPLDHGGNGAFPLDVTNLRPEDAAGEIVRWLAFADTISRT